MSKVFIPQCPVQRGLQHDITDARRFGYLVTVFHPENSKFRHEVFPDTADERMPILVERATEVLNSFNPSTDYLALTGGSLFISVCLWVLASHNPIKLLRYDRKESAYYPITLSHKPK